MISKIKEVKNEKSNPNGTNYCLVVLEDKTEGWYSGYKGDFPFKIGQEVEYSITITAKGGKKISLSIPAKTEAKTVIPPSTLKWDGGKGVRDMKFEARMHIKELLVRLLIAGKIEFNEEAEYFQSWVNAMDISIDEIKG